MLDKPWEESMEIEEEDKASEQLKIVTLEELRERLVELSRDGKVEKIKDLIRKFGGNKLTEIPEEKYGEMLGEVEKW